MNTVRFNANVPTLIFPHNPLRKILYAQTEATCDLYLKFVAKAYDAVFLTTTMEIP
jgi:hypothetical protein